MKKKSVIITGSTGAIGKAIARQMAASRKFRVILACRNESLASKTVAELKDTTQNQEIVYEILDISKKESVADFASHFKGPLHVLVNNAAITPRKRMQTSEGVELQWATNVLGYYWMMRFFKKALEAGAPSRVVNVASYWAGGLNLADPEFKKRPYDNDQAYRQSKQADRMLSTYLAEKFKDSGVRVNACHSGDVNSKLSNNLGFGGHESPDQGADTPVWLATQSSGGEITGQYFEHQRQKTCSFSQNQNALEALAKLCEKY